MASKSLTVRNLILQLMICENMDAPVSTKNINDNNDEFNDENPQNPQEIISIADNTGDGGDAVLYFLGDIPTDDED